MHTGNSHDVHKACTAHVCIKWEIPIEIRLLSQHQRFHEDGDFRGKYRFGQV